LGTLNEAKDVLEIGHEEEMKGIQLKDPVVRFRQIANLKNGSIMNKGELFKSHTFINWMFVYSKYNQQDFHDASQIELLLREASKTYGISYK
jgi:hypothetical protein